MSTLRDLALMAGGIGAGIVLSRLLPPVYSQTRGTLGVRFGDDPFDLLVQDHRRILETLREMEEVPQDQMARRGRLFMTVKRKLAKHAMAEEDVVYPLLHGQEGEAQHVEQLYREHADIKMHLYHIEKLLMANENWSDRVRSLREIIERHARDEEENEFPMLRRRVGQSKEGQLAGQIRREEALVL